ncbi:hypothetical protein B0J11DRAFT_534163 [Dendryphion nanum]|uniref:Uncharacterized protein n=1 Tax=Dendryphion nanum TaxID=256645 RepID=A0A9P9IHC1_9PLEO|nr:hypothetical protein B0J11DRAFT_534163 [Dendryphion nanum]
MVECKKGIQELEIYREKCADVNLNPRDWKEKMKLLKAKSLFPFRKESLESLQIILDRLQSNLHTVVLVLQLAMSVFHKAQVNTTSRVVTRGIEVILRRQTGQQNLIERLDDRLKSRTTEASANKIITKQLLDASGREGQLEYFSGPREGVMRKLDSPIAIKN